MTAGTYDFIEFEWDEEKAASNLRKHHVSFPVATGVFLDRYRMEDSDPGEEYGEDCFIALGFASSLIMAVVFTLRGDRIRLISARKANRHERERYTNRRISSGSEEPAGNDG
jgi:uncharacterized protein